MIEITVPITHQNIKRISLNGVPMSASLREKQKKLTQMGYRDELGYRNELMR